MNNPLDPTLRGLNDFGCCSGTGKETPVNIDNRPGLRAIAFRAGTHPQFKATLLAALSNTTRMAQHLKDAGLEDVSRHLPLAISQLRTREDDDFTIALLDAWATVSDVLAFCSERIANESYLCTATERRSVLELARAIGYELNPGVAASTLLALNVEDAPGSPGYANIPRGTKVQSVPGPDEKPQIYETIEPFVARKEWNELKPQRLQGQRITRGITKLYLKGINTQLQPGDAILIVGDEREKTHGNEQWDFRIIETVALYREQGCTVITWAKGLGWRRDQNTFVDPAAENVVIFTFRQRGALFGYNAPDWRAMPESIQKAYKQNYDSSNPGTQWPDFEIKITKRNEIDLDAIYPKIAVGSWIVLDRPGYTELYKVTSVATSARTDFTLTAKTTRVGLDAEEHLSWFGLRNTVVFAQAQELEMAEQPVTNRVEGDKIDLDRAVQALEPGRVILLSGRRRKQVQIAVELDFFAKDGLSIRKLNKKEVLEVIESPSAEPDGTLRWHLVDKDGNVGFVMTKPGNMLLMSTAAEDQTVNELAFIKETQLSSDKERTILFLMNPLKNTYDPTAVTIFANVAPATHGETVNEILGSGDATQPHQRFVLKQKPVTYTPAANPSGGETSLDIWVNDVKWQEVPSLFGRGPSERVYVTRLADDGTVTVLFGDGKSGARLPTGQENVRTVYRKGIGLEGLVKTEQLSLLMTRPLGVKSVRNPRASEGAADPQSLADARRNAPFTALTLDRVVSLQDYEDFARGFSGIAKALATWTWNVQSRGVFITVAGPAGAPVSDDSATRENLLSALGSFQKPGAPVPMKFGNPLVPVQVKSYGKAQFRLKGTVYVASDRVPDKVLAAVQDALKAAFSFDARAFGQSVALSEVESVIQNVAGVVAVGIDELDRVPGGQRSAIVTAAKPAAGAAADQVQPAELLTLDETSLADLVVKTYDLRR